MGDDKKKGGGGGFFKKLILALILVPSIAWVGYFGYAKATGKTPTCLYTVICEKFKQ